jgi:hypothetical protein
MAIATDRAGALVQTTNDLEQPGFIFSDAVRKFEPGSMGIGDYSKAIVSVGL